MSRHGTVLPIPDSGPLREAINGVIAEWSQYQGAFPFPRSSWLSRMERLLVVNFPASSSRDRNLTARSLAPFPLTEHDWL